MLIARSLPILLALTLVPACGPVIELPEDDTSSSGEATTGPVTTASPSTTSTSTVSTSTSTTTSSSSGSTDDVVDDTGAPFIIEPDGGGCIVSGDDPWHCSFCDLFAQDCPPGEKCMPWANDGGNEWNRTRCSPIDDDPGQPGDECTVEGSGVSGIDDCDLGVMCWDVDPDTKVGTCVAMCTGDEVFPMCRSEQDRCLIANDGWLVLCLPTCDPLVPDVCAVGEACTAVNEHPMCIPSEGVVVPLCSAAVCNPSEACVGGDTLATCMEPECCTPWCDLNAADPDALCAAEPMHSCQPYYGPGEAPVGLEHLGVCHLAA
ncbi:hypothetical protein [Paraliomyxa miuraensis]|uniref:hypothetical protein n=1 Tax=Paraliomyxa miuraensis TaxID=376150 RepID=UPI00224DF76C|nr:hypothetical protein [Paraliomyxa miuraensis]MCX4247551.1 hypothetical protein [Paraliomyxa miuraensis]